MVLTEAQWRRIKEIRWDKGESRRVGQLVDNKNLMVGWDRQQGVWLLAHLCDVTVLSSFGVRTIPTAERAPVVWNQWRDDGAQSEEHPSGVPLSIRDPRLVPFIRRCDLWRGGARNYLKKFDHDDWLDEQKQKSEDDDLHYIAKHLAYPRVKKQSDQMCGSVSRSPVERKWHVPSHMKPWWEKTHDRAVA